MAHWPADYVTNLGDDELIVVLSARCMLLHSIIKRVRAYGTRMSFDLTIHRPPWGGPATYPSLAMPGLPHSLIGNASSER